MGAATEADSGREDFFRTFSRGSGADTGRENTFGEVSVDFEADSDRKEFSGAGRGGGRRFVVFGESGREEFSVKVLVFSGRGDKSLW